MNIAGRFVWSVLGWKLQKRRTGIEGSESKADLSRRLRESSEALGTT